MNQGIAIIGATGNVGRKIIELLLERESVRKESLSLFASSRSHGKKLLIGKNEFTVQDLAFCDFSKYKAALFATESEISQKYAPHAHDSGSLVIDSSSFFRMHKNVPLVVEPVNGNLVTKECRFYSTPNCLASPISVVLKPLDDAFKALRVVASTYQSTSGAGKEAIDELFRESKNVLEGGLAQKKVFARPIAFNVIPQVDKILEDGFTKEEKKIILEVKKLVRDSIDVVATSVRVPVAVGHSISLSLQFKNKFTLDEVIKVLKNSYGVKLSDDSYETPLEIEGSDLVHVGRLRIDPTVPNGLLLWLTSDNLRRGAALDAVEIFEKFTDCH